MPSAPAIAVTTRATGLGNQPRNSCAALTEMSPPSAASTHEPRLIGEVTLTTRSMLRKRAGLPAFGSPAKPGRSSQTLPPEEGRRDAGGERSGRCHRACVDPRQVARRDLRVGWQRVRLGLVEQQEERTHAADTVARVVAVELRALDAGALELDDPAVPP